MMFSFSPRPREGRTLFGGDDRARLVAVEHDQRVVAFQLLKRLGDRVDELRPILQGPSIKCATTSVSGLGLELVSKLLKLLFDGRKTR